MIPDNALTRTYAQTLLSVSKRRKKRAILIPQIQALLNLFHEHPRFRDFLGAPNISRGDKEKFIHNILTDMCDLLIIHFLFVLIGHGRGFFAADILEEFLVMEEHDRCLFEAEIRTAIPLPDSLKEQLRRILERYTGIMLRINYIIDSAIIGGVFFKYDDFMIDDTVRGRLQEIRSHLKETPAF